MGLWEETQEAVALVRTKYAKTPAVGIVLGSGLGGFATAIESPVQVPYADIPHFPPSTVAGHAGELLLGDIAGVPCAVMSGRVHYYEGHSIDRATFGVRVLGSLGIKTLLLTNAAGGANPTYEPGDFMVLNDHLNMTGANPLRGPNDERFGPRFPDMTAAYDGDVRRAWHAAGRATGITLRDGIYAAVSGPNYETPAEVRMLQRLGADAVGMSTAIETIVARHMGLRVGALSVITNRAAGLSGLPLSHADVTEIANRVKNSLSDLLTHMVQTLA